MYFIIYQNKKQYGIDIFLSKQTRNFGKGVTARKKRGILRKYIFFCLHTAINYAIITKQ